MNIPAVREAAAIKDVSACRYTYIVYRQLVADTRMLPAIHKKMKELLRRLGLYETLDLELRLNLDQISDSLKRINDSEQITLFNLSLTSIVDYKGTYREVNEKNRLPVHFDIYPRHYIIFLTGLLSLTLVLSVFGLGISILSFSSEEYITALGALALYLVLLLLFPIRLLKRMQWRVWDLRLDLEKELKRNEKQILSNVSD